MKCPECSSAETINDSGTIFCKKCGLELDIDFMQQGKGRAKVINLNKVLFLSDENQELYALKTGIKTGNLIFGWENIFGFKIKENSPKIKDRAIELIKKAHARHNLAQSCTRIEKQWRKTENLYFIETEKIWGPWPSKDFTCFVCLSPKFGLHNTPRKELIIQHSLKHPNYIIAHELFFILYRTYTAQSYKEGYTEADKKLSRLAAAFTLLKSPVKKCFPEMSFCLNSFAGQYNNLAAELEPYWDKDLNSFMEKGYELLGEKKTFLKNY